MACELGCGSCLTPSKTQVLKRVERNGANGFKSLGQGLDLGGSVGIFPDGTQYLNLPQIADKPLQSRARYTESIRHV
jgi:hypothetical protein